MPDQPVVEVDVRGRFGSFRLDARFTAGHGVTALFGRSGAGKTSLINFLAGLNRPDDGRIAVDGHVLFDSAAGVDLPPERRRLGYVFQDGRLFPHLDVGANLAYGMRLVPKSQRHHGFDRVVGLLALGELLDRRPATLSGGEKQRVAIGRALLASPRLLLMDEPLAAVDLLHKSEILPFIERLRDDLRIPIVYVSHTVEEVVRLADTLVVLSEGRTVASGPLEQIMNRLDVWPLTGYYDVGVAVTVTVADHDDTFGLTRLTFAGHSLLVPRLQLPEAATLRVRVRARDVALSLTRPEATSVLNILEARVVEIDRRGAPRVDILLDVGQPLIARVTQKSVHDLGLAPGHKVFALVKAVAVDRPTSSLASGERLPKTPPG
jgi:molybdate transport system ATP-binding protein